MGDKNDERNSKNRVKSFTGSIFGDQMLAGTGAGLITTLILHPLDLVKTRFQVHDGRQARDFLPKGWYTLDLKSAVLPRSTSNTSFNLFTMNYLKDIYMKQGMKGWYQGLSANLAGSMVSWGAYFSLYYYSKDMISDGGNRKLIPFHYFIASSISGLMTVLLTNPLWLMKTRLCLQADPSASNSQIKYRGLIHGLISVWRTEGIRGYYKGLIPGMIGVSHGGVQFMVYEELKKWRESKQELKLENEKSRDLHSYHHPPKLSNTEYIVMSSISKLIATLTTYPYQVVRSRLQDKRGDSTGIPYKGVIDIIERIIKFEGFIGFYKGLVPNLIRVLPGTCITFVTYEQISRACRENSKES